MAIVAGVASPSDNPTPLGVPEVAIVLVVAVVLVLVVVAVVAVEKAECSVDDAFVMSALLIVYAAPLAFIVPLLVVCRDGVPSDGPEELTLKKLADS